MITIAIDPGKSGAIAWHDSVTGKILTEKMPGTLVDRKTFLDTIQRDDGICECWIEEINTALFGGKHPSAIMQVYGQYRELLGVLTTLGVPARPVKAVKWQKSIPNMPRRPKTQGMEPETRARALAEHRRASKLRIKDEMQMRYPRLRVTDWNADALAILTYAIDVLPGVRG